MNEYLINITDIKHIYNHVSDPRSRSIFNNRLMWSLTGDTQYNRNTVCTLEEGKSAYQFMRETGVPIGIFGAGDVGRHLVHTYDDLPIECFIDNKKAGTVYEGKPVIFLEDFCRYYPDGRIVISTKLYHEEIMDQLQKNGIKETRIMNIGQIYRQLNHKQYFDLTILNDYRRKREVFVDGGAYDGETTVDFYKWCGDDSEGFAYVWEPDRDNINKCVDNLGGLKHTFVQRGMWDRETELRLKSFGTGSVIDPEGDIVIQTGCIDHICDGEITFIKMDKEGAERQALIGAKETISKYKPKLAISIYHKAEDIWELPKLILDYDDSYQFYLRHYSFADNETVLYAV